MDNISPDYKDIRKGIGSFLKRASRQDTFAEGFYKRWAPEHAHEWDGFKESDAFPREMLVYLNKQNEGTSHKIEPLFCEMPPLVKKLMWFFLAKQTKKEPGFALFGAIMTLCAVTSRSYSSTEENHTNLFAAVIGTSGSGKETVLSQVKNMLDWTIGSSSYCGGYQSAGGVVSELIQNPRHIALIDELGKHIGSIDANSNKREALTTLMELFSKSNSSYVPPTYSSMATLLKKPEEVIRPVVFNPCISMLGTTTPETFFDSLNKDMIKDGFLSRLLVYRSRIGRQKRSRQREKVSQLQIIKKINEICQAIVPNYDQRAITEEIYITSGAYEVFDHFEDRIMALQDENEQYSDVLNRSVEKAMRIATMAAATSQEDAISPEHARWSVSVVEYCDQALLDDVKTKMSQNIIEKEKNAILEIIRGKDLVTYSSIVKKTKHLTKAARDQYIDDLVQSREIIDLSVGDERVYRGV